MPKSPSMRRVPSFESSVPWGRRPMNDQRLQRSPPSTDSSRKPVAVADHPGERSDRGGEVGEHLAPHRHDPMTGGEAAELVELGEDGHRIS